MKINQIKELTNVGKRYRAYVDAVRNNFPHLGERERVRLGICFVKLVRGTFPDNVYKGFRYSDYHSDEG